MALIKADPQLLIWRYHLMDLCIHGVHEKSIRHPEIVNVVPSKTDAVVDTIGKTRVLPELTKVYICCKYLEER